MALNKAIEHKKEKRKPYSLYALAKSVSKQCRNHGSCEWCKKNRLHSNKVREMKYKEE